MRRGELWTAAGGKRYAGRPRPLLVVQDDRFDATELTTMPRTTLDRHIGTVPDTVMLTLARALVVFLGLA